MHTNGEFRQPVYGPAASDKLTSKLYRAAGCVTSSFLALAVSGQPAGVTTSFSPATLVPGTGVSNLTITVASNAVAGTYNLAIAAGASSFSETVTVPLTLIVPPSLNLTLASSSLSIVQASPATVGVTIADVGTFSAATSLSLSGLPIGMTGSFAPTGFAAPGAGSSTLTLLPSTSTPPGKYTVNVVAAGGGLIKSLPVVVTVTAAPNFTLTANQSATSVQVGQGTASTTYTVSQLTNGFNGPVTFSITGLPAGVTSAFSKPTLAAPGTGTSTLTLTPSATVTPGQYKLTVTAAGLTVLQSSSLQLIVLGAPGFTLKTDVSSLALRAGAVFTTNVSVTPMYGFNSPVALSLGTVPTGITATLSSSTLSGATGTATLTIQTASTLANGTYPITLSGTSSVIATALPGQMTTLTVNVGTVVTTLSASALTIKRGTTGTVTVTATGTRFYRFGRLLRFGLSCFGHLCVFAERRAGLGLYANDDHRWLDGVGGKLRSYGP